MYIPLIQIYLSTHNTVFIGDIHVGWGGGG